MNFIYLLTGWEGSAADSRILRDAVTRDNGLRVPTGNYYLVDNGYTNGEGFLAPYRGNMESTGALKKCTSSKNCVSNSRRCWTVLEEQTLILGLKDIVSRGWKCENGFKTGYLGTLEQYMVQKFPGTDLKASPHIHSKIHVWKKHYGALSTMLSRSGFGWNDSNNTIDVVDDQVWQDYIKTDVNARSMRYKSWPFYKDWSQIFGKDRATGEHNEAFTEAINDLVSNSNKGKEHMSNDDDEVPQLDPSNADSYSQYMSFSRVDEATSTKTKSKAKKRSRSDPNDGGYAEMASKFFEKMEAQMAELVSRMGFEKDVSAARKQVFDALANMQHLTFEERLKATSRICDNPKDLDIFFCLSDDHKANMVQLILDGRY
ncbi:PREDICTED: uncharacterized protein LOC105957141 [Erythranthe guttata]|uniref:uncharacterized protein LOC105957141 n=1 Tax=Erythranthe guttata TaxID=4155 RepID=UPI00064D8EB4|nr:PREDICTED: uncharacterized protein LOC105957141 [Erythranthe guttata]|eukprot:XP_012836526.1 PREDICTED: uncharacterized protein LOC105957141 [Erythranthe guttata]